MARRPLMLVCLLRAFGAAVIVLAPGGVALGQSANDTCGQDMSAFMIPPGGGMISGTLETATRDALSTSCPGNQTGADVYHYITPTTTGMYTFETCSLTPWDTVLSVHTLPCPPSAATEVAGGCNDDSCGLQSRISVVLAPGQTYLLRVGAYNSMTIAGAYTIAVTVTPPLTNDECGPGNPALQLDTPVTGDNTGASTSLTVAPSSLCGTTSGSGGGADVFYNFVPPVSAGYIFSTCGSALDTVLSVHSGCPATAANLLGCNDDGLSGTCPNGALNSRVAMVLPAGQNCVVRVAGWRSGSATGVPRTGAFTLVVRMDANVPVGACCNASGACSVSPGSICSGVYQSDGTACDAAICAPATGACCIGATCTLRTPAECVSPAPNIGAAWNGSPTCGDTTSGNLPCCQADFNKVGGITVQDIFDYLAAWFGGSPFTHLAGDGTGSPTVQDIFDFLAAWFTGGC